jgi:hypothetical protein
MSGVSHNIAPSAAFTTWLTDELLAGVRLVLMEGLPRAGKSRLLRGLPPGAIGLQLDNLIPDGELETESWTSAVLRKGAVSEIWRLLSANHLVIADGISAWGALEGKFPVSTRLVYVTRLDRYGGDVDRNLGPLAPASIPLAEAYRHHDEDRPWERADLLVERVDFEPHPSEYRLLYPKEQS